MEREAGTVKSEPLDEIERKTTMSKRNLKYMELYRDIKELELRKRELELQKRELDQKCEAKKKAIEVVEGTLMKLQVEMKTYQDLCKSVKELALWKKQLQSKVRDIEDYAEQKYKACQAQKEQLDSRDRTLELREKKFEERANAFAIREKSKEVQYQQLEKKFEERVKAFEIVENSKKGLVQSEIQEEDYQLKEKRGKDESLCVDNDSSGNVVLQVELEREHVHMLLDGYKINLSSQEEVSEALGLSSDPVMLVLEAMESLYPPYLMNCDIIKVNAVRSCVLLLEELVSISPKIESEHREHAMDLALNWKDILSVGNSSEVLAFLYLLALFDLAPSFDTKEVMSLLQTVAEHWKRPALCHHLGLKDKMPGFVEELIRKKQQLLAIEYVFEFDLVQNFPPVNLLKQHVLDLKSAGKTAESNDHAIIEEISGLKKVVECILSHKLEEEFSPDGIMERIGELKAQMKSLKISHRKRTSYVGGKAREPPAKKRVNSKRESCGSIV